MNQAVQEPNIFATDKSEATLPNTQETIGNSVTTNNNDYVIIEDDNQARFEQIFKITTPHSSRSYSIRNSNANTHQNSENGEENSFSNERSTKKSNKKETKEDDLNEEPDIVQNALQNLIKSREIPPEEVQPQVLRSLKTLFLNALIEEDYDKASQLEDLLKYVGDNYESQVNKALRELQTKALESRLNLARDILNKKTSEWDDIYIMFKEDQKKRRSELEEKLSSQQQEFEAHWNDPNNLIMFKKPSPQLLQLKKQQKLLAITKKFEEAKQVKRMADRLQIAESQEAQNRAVSAMKTQYRKLADDQSREVDCFVEHERRIERFMAAERAKAIGPCVMLIRQLEAAVEAGRPTNLKPRKEVFTSNRRTRLIRTEAAIPPASPRTTRAMSNFMFADEPEKLKVDGINVKKEIKKRSKIRVRSRRSNSTAASVRVSKVWR